MTEVVTFFETLEELETITGLSEDELKEAGFHIDGINWGCISDNIDYVPLCINKDGWNVRDIDDNALPKYMRDAFDVLNGINAGFYVVRYNNRLYLTHHFYS